MSRAPSMALVYLAALVIIAAGIKISASVLVPFVSAFFISLLFLPLITWLHSLRIPAFVSTLVVMVALISALLGVGWLFYGAVAEFKQFFLIHQDKLTMRFAQIQELMGRFGNKEAGISSLRISIANMLKNQSDRIFSFAKDLTATLTSSLFVMVIVAFTTLEAASIRLKFKLLSHRSSESFQRIVAQCFPLHSCQNTRLIFHSGR